MLSNESNIISYCQILNANMSNCACSLMYFVGEKSFSRSQILLSRRSDCFGSVRDEFIGLFLPLTTGQEFREEQITFGCAKLNHLYGFDLIFSLLVVSA